MGSLLLLPIIFCCSAGFLVLLYQSAPSATDEMRTRLKFPYSLSQLRDLADLLRSYNVLHPFYVFALFCSSYLFKQCFSIPGSVFLNILAGALYGFWGFPLVCVLTALGATACYQLSSQFGKAIVQRYCAAQLAGLQKKIHDNDGSLIWFLLFARVFPLSPNWFLNVASPCVGIPIRLFFVSVLLGLMPYNLICVQSGIIIEQIETMDDIFTRRILAQLAVIAAALLLPAYFAARTGPSTASSAGGRSAQAAKISSKEKET